MVVFVYSANNGPDNDSLQNVILGFSPNATQSKCDLSISYLLFQTLVVMMRVMLP